MTTASDNFNRANETPLASPWASVSVTGDIIGGAALSGNAMSGGGGSTRVSVYNSGTWANDQTSEGTVGGLGSGSHYAIFVARFTTSGNGYAVDTDSGNAVIYRVTGGTFTTLKTTSTTFANGNTMGIRTSGNTIYLRKNGSDVDSTTDSTYPTGGLPGIGGFGNATIDDWSASDAGGGASATAKIVQLLGG